MITINERQQQLISNLVRNKEFTAMKVFADLYDVSYRTIYNDLAAIEPLFISNGLTLQRKPRYGVRLVGSSEGFSKLIANIGIDINLDTLDYIKSRRNTLMFEYSLLSNKYHSIEKNSSRFFVSSSSIVNDNEYIERKFNQSNVKLMRSKKGVFIQGKELDIRKIIFNHLVNELVYNTTEDGINTIDVLIRENIFDIQDSILSIYNYVRTVLFEINAEKEFEINEPYLSDSFVYIVIMILRIKQGMTFENSDDLYKPKNMINKGLKSYTKKMCDTLEIKFRININQWERENIRRHLISGGLSQKDIQLLVKNTQTDNDESLTIYYTKALIEIMSTLFGVDFMNHIYLHSNLRFHVKSMLNRINFDIKISNMIIDDLINNYPFEFTLTQIATTVTTEACTTVNFLPLEEVAYLMVYFQTAIEKQSEKLNAYLISRDSVGSSLLAKTRIEKRFHQLSITKIINPQNIMNEKYENVDIIISTHKIDLNVPYIEVSPLMNDLDEIRIEQYLDKFNNGSDPRNSDAKISIVNEQITDKNKFHIIKLINDCELILQKESKMSNYITRENNTFKIIYDTNQNLNVLLRFLLKEQFRFSERVLDV